MRTYEEHQNILTMHKDGYNQSEVGIKGYAILLSRVLNMKLKENLILETNVKIVIN